jgi:hypothetical protein
MKFKNKIKSATIGLCSLLVISCDELTSSLTTDEVRNAPIEFRVSDRVIAREYEQNEVGANLKYENKVGVVTGAIMEISKDFGISSVTLDGANITAVDCQFDEEYASQLATLRKGQNITIKGVCDGMWGAVSFVSCVIMTPEVEVKSN